MVEGSISRVKLPLDGSMFSTGTSMNSVSKTDSSICARSGIMMDRAMRGSSGAPLSSMGTLPGNVIRFFPFGSCSIKYPPTSNDISRCLSEIEFTSQLGSDGRDAPVSTHWRAKSPVIMKDRTIINFDAIFMNTIEVNVCSGNNTFQGKAKLILLLSLFLSFGI